MIISASRRTDIPAFYSDWFINRIQEGYLLVPNPYNPNIISKVSLLPDVVDCIVFWTKNPAPMIDKLPRLSNYHYYFQYTLNPYEKDIESFLPSLNKRIETLKRLSDKIGKEKIIWRYDPILTNEKYNIQFHKEAFAEISDTLKNHTDKCMIGFIDHYQHIRTSMNKLNVKPLQPEEINEMAVAFKQTADHHSIELETCTVKVDLSSLGIKSGMCIDKEHIEKIIGYNISAKKDKNQRDVCRCIESIDIGTYESCLHGCAYCYAIKGNYTTASGNQKTHNVNSPILIGEPHPEMIIKDRVMKSLREDPTLF